MACVPCDNKTVVLQKHPTAGVCFQGVCRKLGKVLCKQCDNNLGNIQQMLERDGTASKKQWYIKVKSEDLEGVGFRKQYDHNTSAVQAASPTILFTHVCRKYDLDGVWRMPWFVCPAASPTCGKVCPCNDDVDPVDKLLEKIANARISWNPPHRHCHRRGTDLVNAA